MLQQTLVVAALIKGDFSQFSNYCLRLASFLESCSPHGELVYPREIISRCWYWADNSTQMIDVVSSILLINALTMTIALMS